VGIPTDSTQPTGDTSVPGRVTWTGINLAKDAYTNLFVTVTPSRTGPLTNQAYATSPAGNSNTNQVQTTLGNVANLVTVKTGAANATNGVAFTYTIAVTNNGPSAASGMTVTDLLPVGIPADST
jgi:uncharacterized repeat protein (TIGR01451 family)